MSHTAAVIIAVVVCIAAAAVALLVGMRLFRRSRRAEKLRERQGDQVRYAFIINPSKPQAQQHKSRIRQFCRNHDITDFEFIDTTLAKDGRDCALEALARGADVLIAVGGDGTVRTVASAISGTGHTLGIVPTGTGNLFARNMGIPIDDIDAALTVATSRGERYVDVGRMSLLDDEAQDHPHAFLIIAGIGFDAQMIDDTDPELKKNLSWLAYFSGGMKNLFAPKYRGSVTVTSKDGSLHTVNRLTFRTLMSGNCGQIPVFSLMPNAVYDDGLLDFEVIDTTGGLLGWMHLFTDVVNQTITGRAEQAPWSTNSTIDQMQGISAEVTLEKPAMTEVDGDMLKKTRHIKFTIEPRSLCVRAPIAAAEQH